MTGEVKTPVMRVSKHRQHRESPVKLGEFPKTVEAWDEDDCIPDPTPTPMIDGGGADWDAMQ